MSAVRFGPARQTYLLSAISRCHPPAAALRSPLHLCTPPPSLSPAVALGWGVGLGFGTQYIDVRPEFAEKRTHRPSAVQQVKYAIRRLATLAQRPGAEGVHRVTPK